MLRRVCRGHGRNSSSSSSGDLGTSSGNTSSSGDLGASSGSTSSSGGFGTSSGAPDGGCAPSCEGNDLVTCDGRRTPCALGCKAEAQSRCATFEPQGPASAADLQRAGLADLTLSAAHVVDVINGEIRTEGAPSLRQANTDPSVDELKNNIRFRVESGVAIFVANNITFTGPVGFGGTVGGQVSPDLATIPVVFVAQNEIRVTTTLTLPCGRLGGGVGGNPEVNDGAGGGLGGGGFTIGTRTGAGGGHATRGGQAGSRYAEGVYQVGASGGSVNNDPFVLLGGSGGGAGGGGGNKFSRGGGGGGAMFLIAGSAIQIGDGSGLQGINAGGCGGGVWPVAGLSQAGAGGGAGGFIGLEAPIVQAAQNAGLAANGGGGAGRNAAGVVEGRDAQLAPTPAAGGGTAGAPHACHGAGGDGAAEGATAGNGGSGPCSPDSFGGGGGGGLGRIVISSLSGEVTVDAGPGSFFMSPSSTGAKRILLTAE